MEGFKNLYEQAEKSYKERNLVRTASLISRAASLISEDSDQKHDQAFETIFRKIRNGQMR